MNVTAMFKRKKKKNTLSLLAPFEKVAAMKLYRCCLDSLSPTQPQLGGRLEHLLLTEGFSVSLNGVNITFTHIFYTHPNM